MTFFPLKSPPSSWKWSKVKRHLKKSLDVPPTNIPRKNPYVKQRWVMDIFPKNPRVEHNKYTMGTLTRTEKGVHPNCRKQSLPATYEWCYHDLAPALAASEQISPRLGYLSPAWKSELTKTALIRPRNKGMFSNWRILKLDSTHTFSSYG